MTKSQYIHVPSTSEINGFVARAQNIALKLNLPRIPNLMVSSFTNCSPEGDLMGKTSLREKLGRSQNPNSKGLLNELTHYAKIWTALRFDAATMDLTNAFGDSITLERALKSSDRGPVLLETIHNIRECVIDSNTVYTRALHEGLVFFTKTLPRLGKAVDDCLHWDVKPNAFDTCGFELEKAESGLKILRDLPNGEQSKEYIKFPLFLGELFRGFFNSKLFRLGADESDRLRCIELAESEGIGKLYEMRLNEVQGEFYLAARSLRHLRQLCFLFYKLEVPFDKNVVRDLSDTFCKVDSSLPLAFLPPGDDITDFTFRYDIPQYTRFLERHLEKQEEADLGRSGKSPLDVGPTCIRLDAKQAKIARIARFVVNNVLGNANPREIVGRHGPGSVATGEKGLNKAAFSRIYRKLEVRYPFTEYFMYNLTHVVDNYDSMQTRLSYHDEATAKVVFVAKDSRGPRLISCEPLEIQWIQQGLMRVLSDAIESHPLTKGQVNFVDQTINQRAAWLNSITGEKATIDLKDASDRVSVALVDLLFPKEWVDSLLAARSDNTRLPDGRIVELRKFAPMGSATCFPVEALCFFALSVASVYVDENPTDPLKWISRTALRKIAGSILVYGDDLVIPGDNCPGVITALESFHLRVNTQKSYSTGYFRESCGVDAYLGVNVTPVRIKRTWDGQSLPSQATLPSYVALSNALYAKGYLWAAWELERSVQRTLESGGEMLVPYTMRVNPPGLAFIREHRGLYWAPVREKVRFNRKDNREEVLTYVVEPVVKRGSKTGWEEMLRCESNRSEHYSWDFNPNVCRAGRYAVPRSERIVLRWMPYSRE